MKNQHAKYAFIAMTMGAILLMASGRSLANPVNVAFIDTTSPCPAVLPFRFLNDEVGKEPPFPSGEDITYSVATGVTVDCGVAATGSAAGDYSVTATNTTGQDLLNVHVVQNTGTTFGNWDGTILGERAKFLVAVWPNNAVIMFHLLDVVPIASPTFDHLGVPHVGSSNFSIVAGPNEVPTVSQWGVAVMALLVLAAATIVIRGRRPATA